RSPWLSLQHSCRQNHFACLHPPSENQAVFISRVQRPVTWDDRQLARTPLPPELHRERRTRDLVKVLGPIQLASLEKFEQVVRLLDHTPPRRLPSENFQLCQAHVLDRRDVRPGQRHAAALKQRPQIELRRSGEEIVPPKERPAKDLEQDFLFLLSAAV